jgi:hypothetical protein
MANLTRQIRKNVAKRNGDIGKPGTINKQIPAKKASK